MYKVTVCSLMSCTLDREVGRWNMCYTCQCERMFITWAFQAHCMKSKHSPISHLVKVRWRWCVCCLTSMIYWYSQSHSHTPSINHTHTEIPYAVHPFSISSNLALWSWAPRLSIYLIALMPVKFNLPLWSCAQWVAQKLISPLISNHDSSTTAVGHILSMPAFELMPVKTFIFNLVQSCSLIMCPVGWAQPHGPYLLSSTINIQLDKYRLVSPQTHAVTLNSMNNSITGLY